MNEDKRGYINNKIIIEERQNVILNGVTEVLSFDEENIVCNTDLGLIMVKGRGIHITRLDLEARVLCAQGDIDSAEYGEESMGTSGLFKKLFR